MAFLDENGVAQLWDAVKDRLAGAFDSVEFNVAQQAANLVSGDSIATAFGKLAKNYTSLVDQISNLSTNKFDKNKVVANYTTQGTGYALDASLGPAIKTKMDLADTLNAKVSNMDTAGFRRYFAQSVDVPAGQWGDIYSFTIPASDTHSWLILGYATDSTAVQHPAAITLKSDPDVNATMGMSRLITQYGGALNCWGFVNPAPNNERTITLAYRNYTSGTLNIYGRMYAFAICDTR